MLLGAKYKVTVGEVEQAHGEEAAKLIQELMSAGGPRVSPLQPRMPSL